MIAILIQDPTVKKMTKIATEDVKEAGKGNLTATDNELKSRKEDEVRTETQVILEMEVQFKETDLQKIFVQDLQKIII